MSDIKLSLIVLFLCFMSAICFDSYWRNKSDDLIEQVRSLRIDVRNNQLLLNRTINKIEEDYECSINFSCQSLTNYKIRLTNKPGNISKYR